MPTALPEQRLTLVTVADGGENRVIREAYPLVAFDDEGRLLAVADVGEGPRVYPVPTLLDMVPGLIGHRIAKEWSEESFKGAAAAILADPDGRSSFGGAASERPPRGLEPGTAVVLARHALADLAASLAGRMKLEPKARDALNAFREQAAADLAGLPDLPPL
jgi:hypothetical protein